MDKDFEILKKFINETLKKETKISGIIVFKNIDGVNKFLVLHRPTGEYDLPKGHIKKNEDPYLAALRETYEETGMRSFTFFSNRISFTYSKFLFYLATTEDDVIIRKNPETNKFEHTGYSWLTYNEAIKNIQKSLIPALKWANEKLNDPNNS